MVCVHIRTVASAALRSPSCSAGRTHPAYKLYQQPLPRLYAMDKALGHGHSESHQFYDSHFDKSFLLLSGLKLLSWAPVHCIS